MPLLILQPEPLAQQIAMEALVGAAAALGSICIMAWRGINKKIDKMMAYQHNAMMLNFKMLTRLHPNQAHVINQSMQEYLLIKPTEAGMTRSARAGG